jgi:ketosteroid isomerase-like protein
MSKNLDLVRSIYAAWERGDYSSAEWAHPEIEYVTADGPAPGRWTGLHGLGEAWRSILSAWEEFRTESVDEFRELDDQRVLVLHRWGGRGKRSGVELGQVPAKGASLFHLRNGKVTRAVTYFDRERALADLGLKE